MAQRGPWLLRLGKWPSISIDGNSHPIDDLGYLERHVATLRELAVDGEQPVDLTTINRLTALEKLTIDSLDQQQPPGRLVLRRLRRLHTLHLWSPLTIDWSEAPELEDLQITEPSESDLEAIGALTTLDVLHLDLTPRVPHLSSPQLRRLVVAGWHEPSEPIAGIGSVTDLEVLGLAGHRDLSAFSGTAPLEDVEVIDAWELRSLAGLRLADGAAVTLADCPHLTDLAGVDQIPGIQLQISDCPLLEGAP